MKLFDNVYSGKKVLVTGHTGFKGSWLMLWLKQLGAAVAGYSLYLPSDPCHYSVLGFDVDDAHGNADIRDYESLRNTMLECQPDIVFHLAAQPLVRHSYEEPKKTFDTNIGGTVNILECIREVDSVKAAVIITSDKCYKNIEIEDGYCEDDRLGGSDPYSASKAGAELVAQSYEDSFFSNDRQVCVATTRAGNVIGGGDWAEDRIVPDCIRAWTAGSDVSIRKPHATRPWQHVLEPISGYLWLGAQLYQNNQKATGEAFNFGPDDSVVKTVQELVEEMQKTFGDSTITYGKEDAGKKEAQLLRLNCTKIKERIGWEPVLDFEKTVRLTSQWYKDFCDGVFGEERSCKDIQTYINQARQKKVVWFDE